VPVTPSRRWTVLAAAAAVLFLVSLGAGLWLLNSVGLAALAADKTSLPLFQAIVAALAAIATSVLGSIVTFSGALLQRGAQAEIARLNFEYSRSLEQLKAQLLGELETKKQEGMNSLEDRKNLHLADLERVKAQIQDDSEIGRKKQAAYATLAKTANNYYRALEHLAYNTCDLTRISIAEEAMNEAVGDASLLIDKHDLALFFDVMQAGYRLVDKLREAHESSPEKLWAVHGKVLGEAFTTWVDRVATPHGSVA
jgi:hypothetical protein